MSHPGNDRTMPPSGKEIKPWHPRAPQAVPIGGVELGIVRAKPLDEW